MAQPFDGHGIARDIGLTPPRASAGAGPFSYSLRNLTEPTGRLELPTCGLRNRCSRSQKPTTDSPQGSDTEDSADEGEPPDTGRDQDQPFERVREGAIAAPLLAGDHPAAALARARGMQKAAAHINALAARVLAGDPDVAAALVFVDGAERAIARCLAGTCTLSPRAFHADRCARFTGAAEAGSKSRLDTTEPTPSASVGWKPERDLAPAGAV